MQPRALCGETRDRGNVAAAAAHHGTPRKARGWIVVRAFARAPRMTARSRDVGDYAINRQRTTRVSAIQPDNRQRALAPLTDNAEGS